MSPPVKNQVAYRIRGPYLREKARGARGGEFESENISWILIGTRNRESFFHRASSPSPPRCPYFFDRVRVAVSNRRLEISLTTTTTTTTITRWL